MVHCAILSCENDTRHVLRVKGKVSFFRFPSDPKTKEKWIEATGQKNWFPTIHSRICSEHFNEDSFKETNKSRLLIKNAIPTIDIIKTISICENKDQNLGVPEFSPCTTTPKRKLEEDINRPSTSNEGASLLTLKKRKLVKKLNLAKQKIQQKNKEIKRLREQNRRKSLKILNLVYLLEYLKSKTLLNEDQAN